MGIRPEMQETFMKTYRNSEESLYQSEHYDEIEKDMFIKTGSYKTASTYLLQYSDFVYLDFEAIARKYNRYYAKLDRQCKACYNKKSCIQCVYNLPDIDKPKVICLGFMSKKDFEAYQNAHEKR